MARVMSKECDLLITLGVRVRGDTWLGAVVDPRKGGHLLTFQVEGENELRVLLEKAERDLSRGSPVIRSIDSAPHGDLWRVLEDWRSATGQIDC